MAIPTDPKTWLSRDEMAQALTEAGFPTSSKTLQTAATRHPELAYRVNARRAEHQWGPTLAWRQSRLRYRGGTAPAHQQNQAA